MNRLSQETSPYLLQHKDNPVHWYAWSEPAFDAARDQDKPILLSSGYAACHWCHVMAHECFENPDIAAFMNDHFINIKLDREERPDVDRLYMSALHAMGEQGGWPLNVFLTPDRQPFWGGTYFPPEPRYGRPSFLQVLQAIANLWATDRTRATTSGRTLTSHFQSQATTSPTAASLPTPAQLSTLAATMVAACDMVHGGLKGAPKFPQAPIFQFLWQQAQMQAGADTAPAVITTLTNIANGGIYDHLAGGIARYATDAHWLVPHFEKMLYDNAQFISLASRVCLKHPNELLKQRVEQTIAFVLSDMMTADGLFTSSYDADSEGEEGRYYLWDLDEVTRILRANTASLFAQHYDITPTGNFESRNILNRLRSPALLDGSTEAQLEDARHRLLAVRKTRTPPLHDDKILADWNGLMIAALAEAAYVFSRPDWLDQSKTTFNANIATFWKDGTLWHSHRQGRTKHIATAHDYAHLIEAAITLAILGPDQSTLPTALELTSAFERLHWSDTAKGFLLTSQIANDLPANTLPVHDDVTPSPNALMARNYIALSYLTNQPKFLDRAHDIISHHITTAVQNPFAAPAMLSAASMLAAPLQITLHGDETVTSPLLRQALRHTGLDVVVLRKPGDAQPSLTICRGTTCSLPATNEKGVQDALNFIAL